MKTIDAPTSSDPLAHVEQQLEPRLVRQKALRELNDLFRSGRNPSPPPEGFLRGSLVTMSVSRPSDAIVRAVARSYMPWLGKSFDPSASTGTNVLKGSARSQIKALWRSYTPRETPDWNLEAFDFKTRVAPGELDPDVNVLKIDYDHDGNPDFLVRNLLDELVQIDDGVYLGKILFRWRDSWRNIGFFSLRT